MTIVKNNIPETQAKLPALAHEAAKLAGEFLKAKVRETIFFQKESWAPLKPGTLLAKAPETRSLIDEQQMVMSITSKTKGDTSTVGLHRDSKGNAVSIGAVHEFGAPRAGIPKRSFLRSTYTKQKTAVENIIKVVFEKGL